MSSSFFSALTRAKENTKQLVENASAHVSAKLQLHVNSSPPMSNKYPTISSSPTDSHNSVKLEKSDSEIMSMNVTASDVTNRTVSPTSNSPIKFTEPVTISTDSEGLNISISDLNEFIISKSSEVISQSLAKTVSPCMEYNNSSIGNYVSSSTSFCNSLIDNLSNLPIENENPPTSKIGALPKVSVNSSIKISEPYSCNLPNCNLPSCNSENISHLENPNLQNSFENSISIPPEISVSNTGSLNSFPNSELSQASPEILVAQSTLPVDNSESFNLNSPIIQNIYPAVNPKRMCIFCNTKEHNSHNCFKLSHNSEFWHIIYNQKRCKNCLRQFHFANNCFDSSFCLFSQCRRRDKHSPILCKFRYNYSMSNINKSVFNSFRPNNFAFHNEPLAESYQDIFKGGSLISKKFYSQGTQTDLMPSKTIQTQTIGHFESFKLNESRDNHNYINLPLTVENFVSVNKNVCQDSLSTNFNKLSISNSQSLLSSNQLPGSQIISSSSLFLSQPSLVFSTSSPVMSTNTESLVCNINANTSISPNSFVYDPDEISRSFIAEMIPKLRQLPKGDWCKNEYL